MSKINKRIQAKIGQYTAKARIYIQGQARTFALTKQEEDQNQNVLADNVLISHLLAYVLIDYGVTQSFVFLKFIHKLGAMVEYTLFL